jgi:hypothetical protein
MSKTPLSNVVHLDALHRSSAATAGVAKAAPSGAMATEAETEHLTPLEFPLPRDPAELSPGMARFMRVVSGSAGTGAAIGRPHAPASDTRFASRSDDPALAVGLALHFARTSLRAGLPMPPAVLRRLASHAEAGDPTCRLVQDWLAQRMVRSGTRQLWIVSDRSAE